MRISVEDAIEKRRDDHSPLGPQHGTAKTVESRDPAELIEPGQAGEP